MRTIGTVPSGQGEVVVARQADGLASLVCKAHGYSTDLTLNREQALRLARLLRAAVR
ncbi:MAG: hypothetical protein QOJ13_2802 [Gaiellales bacterium]|jgi:hypothetical protein|nr:hypothetical protein [Gaiellales bacterium]